MNVLNVRSGKEMRLTAPAQFSGIEKIIGTEVPYEADILSHRTPVIHIQGPLKTEKILEALGNETIDWKNSYAYGDSLSDVPVLELVGNPVAVRPESRLRTLASERNREII